MLLISRHVVLSLQTKQFFDIKLKLLQTTGRPESFDSVGKNRFLTYLHATVSFTDKADIRYEGVTKGFSREGTAAGSRKTGPGAKGRTPCFLLRWNVCYKHIRICSDGIFVISILE